MPPSESCVQYQVGFGDCKEERGRIDALCWDTKCHTIICCHYWPYIWKSELGLFGSLEEMCKNIGISMWHGSYKQARDRVASPASSCLGSCSVFH